MAWSLAAIEFVAWSVLEEEGAGQEVAEEALKAACVANPFLAWNIAHKEVFGEVRKERRRGGVGAGEGGRTHLLLALVI